MLTSMIKFQFIYMICIFIYKKSFSIYKISFIYNCIISFILALTTYYLSTYSKVLSYTLPLLLFWLITSLLNSHPQISFVAITISFVISFCFYAIFSFITALIITPFFEKPIHFPVFALIAGLIQGLVTQKLFTIKRFRNGIPFLSSTIHLNVATFLGILLLGFTIYMSKEYTTFRRGILGPLCFIAFLVSLAFLIYWWQAQITKSYRRSLELRELESLRTEVAELNLKLQKLSEDNEKLARITHRDNTLITTLKNSTVKYLATDFESPAEAIAVRDKLIHNINDLSAERASLSIDYDETKVRDFDTCILLLDELLHHMDEEAVKHSITFSVHFGTELANFVPKDISESDLIHTVDDLLKNAFKSTLTREKRAVQLQFYKLGKHLVIEVADSGIPFEAESLVNMGIEKRTTYADGSGIGLMDIWSTKEKYGATYHIEEHATVTPFSKKISLTFDKKNRYSIRTWRKQEILQMSRRVDLQVYNHNE